MGVFAVHSLGTFLGITAGVTVLYQLAFFIITITFITDSVTDVAGGTNFLVLALIGLFIEDGRSTRQVVMSSLVCVWAVRLSLFLLVRILQWGRDERYNDHRRDSGKLLGFWAAQALWVWVASLPLTVINSRDSALDVEAGLAALDYVGWALFAAGLVLESVADQQKFAAAMLREGKGGVGARRWCEVGVWAWSRHPNYFGEMLVWWGVTLGCYGGLGSGGATFLYRRRRRRFRVLGLMAGTLQGFWILSTAGPVLVTGLLLGLSGAPVLEHRANNKYSLFQEYHDYRDRTSPLVPLPPSLYSRLPAWVKSWLLFEWELYRKGLCSPLQSLQPPDAIVEIEKGTGGGEAAAEGTAAGA